MDGSLPERSVSEGSESGPRAFTPKGATPLPCSPLGEIAPTSATQLWLIKDLWVANGAGLIGGPPKAGKSWLVLDLALSVATGTKALGRFGVGEPSPVVLFPAEDGASAVRARVDALSRARGIDFTPAVPLHVILADALKLDDVEHRGSLEELLERLRPRLLILDPLVRLHSGSENSAEHVAELLGYLRRVQRRFSVAVMVTHHVSKKLAHHPGDALRGSSDLHAWGDSNLYLQRVKGEKKSAVRLSIEHRFAPSPEPCLLQLHAEGEKAWLELVPESGVEEEADSPSEVKIQPPRSREKPLDDRVMEVLSRSASPLSQRALRAALHVRNADLTAALRALEAERRIENLGRMGGWQLTSRPPAVSSSASDLGFPGTGNESSPEAQS